MGASTLAAAVLVYDGECRVCRLFARLVQLVTLGQGPSMIPLQEGSVKVLLSGMTEDEKHASAHFINKGGEVFSGEDAFHELLREIPAGGKAYRQFERHAWVVRGTNVLYSLGLTLRNRLTCGL